MQRHLQNALAGAQQKGKAHAAEGRQPAQGSIGRPVLGKGMAVGLQKCRAAFGSVSMSAGSSTTLSNPTWLFYLASTPVLLPLFVPVLPNSPGVAWPQVGAGRAQPALLLPPGGVEAAGRGVLRPPLRRVAHHRAPV
jgi:hypothetical protein